VVELRRLFGVVDLLLYGLIGTEEFRESRFDDLRICVGGYTSKLGVGERSK